MPIHAQREIERKNGWPKNKQKTERTWLNIKICHSHLPDPGRGVDRCAFSRPEWSSRTGERWTGCHRSLTWWQSAEQGKNVNNKTIKRWKSCLFLPEFLSVRGIWARLPGRESWASSIGLRRTELETIPTWSLTHGPIYSERRGILLI